MFPDGFSVTAQMGRTKIRHISPTLADALAWRAEYERTGWTCSDPVAVHGRDNVTPIRETR